MKSTVKRALISLAVFAVVYFASDYVIWTASYNVYVKSIEFLAAVIAGGSYWIGSRP